MLQSMRSQRAGHDQVTEQQWHIHMWLQEIRQRHLINLSSISLKVVPCITVVQCHGRHGT